MGYIYSDKSIFSYLTVFIFCLIPIIIFKLKNNSQTVLFAIYYNLLYLPIVISFHMLSSYYDFIFNCSIFFLGFSLTLWLHEVRFYLPKNIGLKELKKVCIQNFTTSSCFFRSSYVISFFLITTTLVLLV